MRGFLFAGWDIFGLICFHLSGKEFEIGDQLADITLNLKLHDHQQTVHESKARFKVIKAGKKFGKSLWAIFEICKQAARKPHGLFWYVAPTYSQAKDIAWRDLKRILPDAIIKKRLENDLKIVFINDSVLQLKGAENEDALRGPNLDGLVIDEAAYIQEYLWTGILQSQLVGSMGPAYFISSPNRWGRNWYTKFCEDAKKKMDAGDAQWAYWHFTIYDNPTLSVPEIDRIHENTTDEIWNLEYLAQESHYAGALYGEFNPDIHVKDFEVKEEWPLYRALDWGIAHPTVCLWFRLDMKEKIVYFENEYVKSGEVIETHAEYIKRFTKKEPEWSVCDPSMKKRNSQTRFTDLEEFRNCGIPCLPADNGARGIDILKMFFKKNMIRISPKCKHLILELKSLQRDDTEGDDCCDCARYGILRIHDSIRSMNVFENETKYVPTNDKRVINFNDPLLFPKKRYQGQSMEWLREEMDFVA